MKEAIESSIEKLSDKITGEVKSDDALRYAQAALNLAHVLSTLDNINRNRK